MVYQATKKASPEKAPVKKKTPKVQMILKRKLTISGPKGGKFDPGTIVTPEMEAAWVDYYKRVTGGPPIRDISWYC